MKMPKHSDEDKARFRALVPEAPGVEVKPMFGSVGAFVNGNMFAGLFGTDVGVKLDEESKAELAAHRGLRSVRARGTADGRLPLVPASFSDEEATAWMERAREHVATFPPKAKKK